MIRGIHYFSAELKTKIDVIPRGCFKMGNSEGKRYNSGNYNFDILDVLAEILS